MSKVKCLFGYHNYTIPKYGTGDSISVCSQIFKACVYCNMFGIRVDDDGFTVWYQSNKDGQWRYYQFTSVINTIITSQGFFFNVQE